MQQSVCRLLLRVVCALSCFSLVLVVGDFGLAQDAQDEVTASPTTWVSVQGKALEATFVRMNEDGVVLKLNTTGKDVSVPLSSLSLESHLQALKLADPAAFSKPLVKADQPPEMEPFVPKVTISSSELLVSPFGSNPNLESFLDTLNKEVERGNVFVAWHALPPRMQTDVETIMTKVMGSVTPQQMIQLRTLFKSIRTVAVDKQAFILGHPAVVQAPDGVEELKKSLPMLASLAESVLAEENWQVENFQQGKMVPWTAEMCSRLAPFVYASIEDAREQIPGMGKLLNYRIVSESSSSGEVELMLPGMPPSKWNVAKFENIWIVPDWMNEMRKGVDEGLKQVGDGVDTSALSIGLLGLNAIAGKLARAESQEEFNEAIDELSQLPGISNLTDAIQMQAAMGAGMQPGGDDPFGAPAMGGGAGAASRQGQAGPAAGMSSQGGPGGNRPGGPPALGTGMPSAGFGSDK